MPTQNQIRLYMFLATQANDARTGWPACPARYGGTGPDDPNWKAVCFRTMSARARALGIPCSEWERAFARQCEAAYSYHAYELRDQTTAGNIAMFIRCHDGLIAWRHRHPDEVHPRVPVQ